MKVLIIGPQGSGKSTQADFIAKSLNVSKISTGDIFRQMAAEETEEGQKIKETMNAGNLIDDETTASLVQKRLANEDCQNGFVLDGYPRNLHQRELFDPKIDKVIYLEIPDEEVIKRLMKRGRQDDSPAAIKVRLSQYYAQTEPLLDYYKTQGKLTEIDGIGSIEEIRQRVEEALYQL